MKPILVALVSYDAAIANVEDEEGRLFIDNAPFEAKVAMLNGLRNVNVKQKENLQIILKTMYDESEIDIPTCFIILDEKIDDEKDCDEFKIGRICKWLKNITDNELDCLVTSDTKYFYFIDELTGRIVKGDGYPIEMRKSTEFVKRMIPLMLYSLKTILVHNGLTGLCQVFGYPLNRISKQKLQDLEKIYESVTNKCFVDILEIDRTVRKDVANNMNLFFHELIRELKYFILVKHKRRSFAGLFQIQYDYKLRYVLWIEVKSFNNPSLLLQKRTDTIANLIEAKGIHEQKSDKASNFQLFDVCCLSCKT